MPKTAFVFARGGSKGLPGKNIRIFAGKPLIAWAIEQALGSAHISRVIVSTDCQTIADISRSHGADVPFLRPSSLATDQSPELLAWRHGLEYLRDVEGAMPDTMISVPATSPLRLSSDIDACIEEFERSGADVVISITEAHRSPWFNMVKRDIDGMYSLVSDDGKGRRLSRRQDAPKTFDVTTVAYVVRSSYVLEYDDLFSGKVSAAVIPTERSSDIDTLQDFEIAEYLMNKRLGKM